MWGACQQGKSGFGGQPAVSDTMRVRTRAREGFGGTGSKPFSSTGHTWLGTVGVRSRSRGGRKVLLEDVALSKLQPGLAADEWPADCPFLLQSRPFGSRTLPRLLIVLPLGLPLLCWLLFPSLTHPAGCDPRPPSAYTERGSSALLPPAVTTL